MNLMRPRVQLGVVALATVVMAAACGSNPKPQKPAMPAKASGPVAPASASPPPPDPVTTLIAASQAHFAAGEREMKLGHLERARFEFDRAVDLLLESPYGGRTDPRLREHFDRLVDRINAHEVTALAQGDGFAETRSEPASIDELLTIATFPKPAADAETTAAVEADLAATEHDVPIPQNSRVLAYVELMQGRLHDYIAESLTRGTKYLPMIQNVFRAEGLPLDLAYIPIIESGFKPTALSKASAKGPWQFMKPTAREQGLKFDWYIDERADFEKATIAAAKYLKSLHKLFNGDWHLVLAAYNGGLGRLQRALKRSGRDDFWAIAQSSKYLPRETREYVPLILAAIVVAKNPAQYGFNITPAEPIEYDKVAVPRAIDLRRVAEWTGSSIDEIQALNPELRRWTTPVRYPQYEVKVPVGTAERFAERLTAASPSEFVSLNWYTVKGGETLTSIARKLRVSRTELAGANHLSVKARVNPGQDLIIPRAPATLLAARTERTAPSEVASRSITGSARLASSTPVAASNTPLTYRVKRGDTLSSIARLFDTTVERIKTLNRLSGSVITPGTKLTIRSR
jgi:membrane-bound lytic murein transglycosylase D